MANFKNGRWDSCFCWQEDDGRYYCFLPDYDLEARGKTKEHALYNLKMKLNKFEMAELAAT